MIEHKGSQRIFRMEENGQKWEKRMKYLSNNQIEVQYMNNQQATVSLEMHDLRMYFIIASTVHKIMY